LILHYRRKMSKNELVQIKHDEAYINNKNQI
jgi:hypothetical protein